MILVEVREYTTGRTVQFNPELVKSLWSGVAENGDIITFISFIPGDNFAVGIPQDKLASTLLELVNSGIQRSSVPYKIKTKLAPAPKTPAANRKARRESARAN